MCFESQLKLPASIERLPLFAKLYKGAFRSGCERNGPIRRFINRVLYYGYEFLNVPIGQGRMNLNVRGENKTIYFDACNRQFNALYFEKYAQGYEPEVTAVITQMMPADGVFYDVGSNWGFFSILLASRTEFTGRIHAFEPWPSSFRDLVQITDQAELQDMIQCHRIAVGASRKEVVMQSGRHSGLSQVVDARTGVRVEQRTLDELELEKPDLIKIDAEGAELEIIRGSAETLRNKRPMLVFEHACDHDNANGLRVLQLLEDFQYRLYAPMIEFSQREQADAYVSFAHGPVIPGYSPSALKLHPISSYSRHALPPYLNLFACHRSQEDRLREHIVELAAA